MKKYELTNEIYRAEIADLIKSAIRDMELRIDNLCEEVYRRSFNFGYDRGYGEAREEVVNTK